MQTPLGRSARQTDLQMRPVRRVHEGNQMTKRVTIPVSNDIDKIRDRLAADTGIVMSYSQVFNFLIHFYVERANEPKSKWKSLS
jgi:hypothetical protein